MLTFQKTTLYQQTLTIIEEILRSVTPTPRSHLAHHNTLANACHLLAQNVAKGLMSKAEERLDYFKKATHHTMEILIALDVAQKNREVKDDTKAYLTSKILQLEKDIQDFPNKQKKVLILSAAMGQGHMSASQAIAEAFQAQYGFDYDVEIIDFMELLNSFINTVTKKSYENTSKFIPILCKLVYETTNRRVKILKILNQLNYPFVLSKIKAFFEEKKPDLLISTFPVWNYLAFEICQKCFANTKLVTVITDSITVHNVWVLANSDVYIVANEDTKKSLLDLQVPKEKIQVLGFPVRLNFLQSLDRRKFLQDLDLDPRRLTLLFLPTAQNLRKNERIITSLLASKQKYNIILITGRDSKLKPKLEKICAGTSVKIIGWTDKMAEFIQSADIVITKAGGAITMECIAALKPMIITSVIPGQEEGNAELIKKYNLGILAHNPTDDIGEQVEYMRKNLGMFQKNLSKVSRPGAALEIAKFLKDLVK